MNFTLRQWTGRIEMAHIIFSHDDCIGHRGQLLPLPHCWRCPYVLLRENYVSHASPSFLSLLIFHYTCHVRAKSIFFTSAKFWRMDAAKQYSWRWRIPATTKQLFAASHLLPGVVPPTKSGRQTVRGSVAITTESGTDGATTTCLV